MKHVYKILDNTGKVLEIGESAKPEIRFKVKTKWKNAKFPDGTSYEIVASFENRQDALKLERDLKLHYGLEWTEHTHLVAIGKKSKNRSIKGGKMSILSPNHNTKKIHTCPHCNKIGKGNIMLRYHFDKCKLKNDTYRYE